MKILCDSREHKGKNNHVLQYFKDNGIEYEENITFKVGDYCCCDNPNLVVDRKQSLNEVYSNLIQSHERFKRECLRAIEQNIELIILVEEEKVKTIDDVAKWVNPRRQRWYMIEKAHLNGKMLKYKNPKKPPISSEQLMAVMRTFEDKYKIKFMFCPKMKCGETMIHILTNQNKEDKP